MTIFLTLQKKKFFEKKNASLGDKKKKEEKFLRENCKCILGDKENASSKLRLTFTQSKNGWRVSENSNQMLLKQIGSHLNNIHYFFEIEFVL